MRVENRKGQRTCVARIGKRSGFNMTFDNGVMISTTHHGDCSDHMEVAVLCDPQDGRDRKWLTHKVTKVYHDVAAFGVDTKELAKLITKAARLSPRLCRK